MYTICDQFHPRLLHIPHWSDVLRTTNLHQYQASFNIKVFFLTGEWRAVDPLSHLTASISWARTLSSMSNRTPVRVFQVTGCLPFPVIHCWRTSMLICSVSFLYLWAIESILAPVSSFRRMRPKSWYFRPISCGMLILLVLPLNLTHSITVGWSAWPPVESQY